MGGGRRGEMEGGGGFMVAFRDWYLGWPGRGFLRVEMVLQRPFSLFLPFLSVSVAVLRVADGRLEGF